MWFPPRLRSTSQRIRVCNRESRALLAAAMSSTFAFTSPQVVRAVGCISTERKRLHTSCSLCTTPTSNGHVLRGKCRM